MASQCAINNLDTIADTFHIDPKVTLCYYRIKFQVDSLVTILLLENKSL